MFTLCNFVGCFFLYKFSTQNRIKNNIDNICIPTNISVIFGKVRYFVFEKKYYLAVQIHKTLQKLIYTQAQK